MRINKRRDKTCYIKKKSFFAMVYDFDLTRCVFLSPRQGPGIENTRLVEKTHMSSQIIRDHIFHIYKYSKLEYIYMNILTLFTRFPKRTLPYPY